MSSAICWLVRFGVPSCSMLAVRCASPGLSAGSVIAPARIIRANETIGRPGFSAHTMFSPLESVALLGTGGLNVGEVAASGIAERSIVPDDTLRGCSGSTESLTNLSNKFDIAACFTSSAVTDV